MTTIVLQAVGSAVGGVVGGPIGASIGRAAGALAGSAIDRRLFGPEPDVVEGPRLGASQILSSQEGAVIPQAFGRVRVGGEMIWATRFEEMQSAQGGAGKGSPREPEVRTYSYHANFALALCEGEIGGIGRIWADGRLIDRERHTIRVHRGTDDQLPDSLIEAKQGAGRAPAYRGTAYLVFERFALADFGNRVPQIGVEVLRPVGAFCEGVTGVNIIPGSSEFAYDPEPVVASDGLLGATALNDHTSVARTDWHASIDELQAVAPNVARASLVVAWFGDDLRAGNCTVRPRAEQPSRHLLRGEDWSVAGLAREQAQLVSRIDDRPAYGGTPSDGAVLRAIADLKRRGLAVVYNPFVMMDIAPGNALPDPWSHGMQPAFPWRGRITCAPAYGRPDSVWGAAPAREQVERFVGTARVEDFSGHEGRVRYDGPDEWSYRRMVLHGAHLCAAAGGVDTFLIGSELRGLTQVSDGRGFPFVDALVRLVADVRRVLPGAQVSYGADWSEYMGFRPGDGDAWFNLDPLWAACDFVGIDNYLPLSDWRDHGDPEGQGRSALDPDMLARNVARGEHHDWFYATQTDREAGRRTPITDGAGEPWVFRAKDLHGWWANPHHERVDGERSSTPTAWQPRSKPIVFTELGCPAVDRGANQPNVFFDPKSSESHLPHFSRGTRNDEMQAAFLEAHARHWSNPANNPQSADGRPMVDFARTLAWAWDARPYPAFPDRADVWSDGGNWRLGHWLNGRLGALRLRDLAAAILARAGFTDVDLHDVEGWATGYLLASPAGPRGALEAVLDLYGVCVLEEGGRLVLRSPGRDAPVQLARNDLVDAEGKPLLARTRGQEADLPRSAVLEHVDPDGDFRVAAVETRRLATASIGQAGLSLPLVLPHAQAMERAERWLQRRWGGRDTATFAVAPDRTDVAPGRLLHLPGSRATWRAETVERGAALAVTARSVSHARVAPAVTASNRIAPPAPAAGPTLAMMLDLPLLDQEPGANGNRIAVAARPWRGPYALYAVGAGEALRLVQEVPLPATVGRLVAPLPPGPTWRWDRANAIEVELLAGDLASEDRLNVLGGANAAAIRGEGGWEVVQFARAELVAPNRWGLRDLLRGQAGTEDLMGAPPGADFVLLDRAVVPLAEPVEAFEGERDHLVVPRGGDLDSVSSARVAATLGARSLLPHAPAHLRATRHGSGSVGLDWVRRDRGRADSWALTQVPLSEAQERYRVEVRRGGETTFTGETTKPRMLLFASSLAGDGPHEIAVSQISAAVGPGPASTITI